MRTVTCVLLSVLLCACGRGAASSGYPLPANGPSPDQTTESSPSTEDSRHLVTRVVDGDTIELEGGERVRLICIDTPERGQPGYAEAKEFLRQLIEGKHVTVTREDGHADRDRYGRLLRLVWIGEELVQAAVIRAGHSQYVDRWGESRTVVKNH